MDTERRIARGESFLDVKKSCATCEFPGKFARYVMEKGEAYYWEPGRFHVVTSAELARSVLKSEDFSADRGSFFISRMPNLDLRLIGDFFSVVRKMMVMSDGDEHADRRRAAAGGFEDPVLERFEAQVARTVKTLLERAFAKRRIEFVTEIAKELPSTVLADLFSIPEGDRADFFRWSNEMTAFFGGASSYENPDGIRVNDSAVRLREYFRSLFADRRANPGDDYATLLVRSQERFGLTDDELLSQAIMMLVAGQVTTTDQICNSLYLIAANPEIQLALRQEPSLLPAALEEFKRYDPAVTFIFRVAKVDTRVGDHLVRAGETVFVSNHAVSRDPRLENPFKLDIRRGHPASHMAYGHGAHYCLGAKLGRLQMNLLLRSLLEDFPFLTLDAERGAHRDHYSLSFSGFSAIHLETM